ncbi:26S proteasome regulatory subunit S5A, multiubiquitin chain binding protein [Metarhizium album ARSEF 1941]|uniref:26S proteasome regulatory subunit S5A, multiubiquitin chain binding protein n=1 Tax=Metarhizium album (strain ARSEF 1941) TaxID=1081103 RepID=A0A0B2WH29_METAS|nr:26S proteasome regulatory subunit S5A, multiubiquitin chain binding protein [Metarhizium album ARSEF 1941]KHN95291.1 26S proteasome regulatory subunit S5A, multiubiquitin chain binding protein [Metarhizium album ARSEF 1941]
MVLEAVMVVVDNSESSRNGDYQPTRFDSQVDAVNVLFQSITQGNAESSVGLMSMGGKGPEVLVTLTTEQGKILEGLHRTKKKIGGSSHLKTGIQVATLALKHRQNRSQRQRIIVFICSPIEESEKELKQLAKKMKKGNISVDFILFGDLDADDTQKKLQVFNDEVKGSEGSHLVVIPPSSKLLSDQLVATPILLGEGAVGSGGAGGGGSMGGGNEEFEFGFDPAMEPELALALRMSMEEEKARQEKRAREEEEAAKKASLGSVKEEDESGPSGGGDKKDGGDKMDTS